MLSIIIPTLNEENYLPGVLTDLKDQDFKDFEIIVSDARSTDKTKEIAKDFGCRVVVSDKEKNHPSIQRNMGANIALGDILLFLDADTRLPNNEFIKKTLDDFNKRGLACASFYLKFESDRFFYKFYYCFYGFFAFLAQYIKPLAVGAGIVIKKNVHQSINGFNEDIHIGEDQHYCNEASKIGKFRMIKKEKIFFSIRRFEKFGRWKLFFKFLYGALYVLLLGPIKKKIVKYDFGEY
ncbi:MAG: glycosyltransferase [Patescibacteria group bacterium]